MSQRPPDVLQRSIARLWVVIAWPFRHWCRECDGRLRWIGRTSRKGQLLCSHCGRAYGYGAWQVGLQIFLGLLGMVLGFALAIALDMTTINDIGRTEPSLWGALFVVYSMFSLPSIALKFMKLKGVQ